MKTSSLELLFHLQRANDTGKAFTPTDDELLKARQQLEVMQGEMDIMRRQLRGRI